MFIEDYDPADVENYEKEFADFMLKLKEYENKEWKIQMWNGRLSVWRRI